MPQLPGTAGVARTSPLGASVPQRPGAELKPPLLPRAPAPVEADSSPPTAQRSPGAGARPGATSSLNELSSLRLPAVAAPSDEHVPPISPALAPRAALAQSEDTLKAVRTLARASRALERASGDLSLAQYRVLSAIASGNEQASKVAARLAMGKPTVSATVEVLCQRGLIDRSGAPGDRRAVVLTLTPEGARLLGQVEAKMTSRIAELCALTPDPAQVLRSLAWLGDALDQAHRLSPRPEHYKVEGEAHPR